MSLLFVGRRAAFSETRYRTVRVVPSSITTAAAVSFVHLLLLLFVATHDHHDHASAAPLSFGVTENECVYARADKDEPLTVSFYVYEGEWLEGDLVFEGPVASESAVRGEDVASDVERYEQEGGDPPRRRAAVADNDDENDERVDDEGLFDGATGALFFGEIVSYEEEELYDDRWEYVEEHDRPAVEENGRPGDEPERATTTRMLEGQSFEKTVRVRAAGWYRACVRPVYGQIHVELDLRRSSAHGPPDPRYGGHVPYRGATTTATDVLDGDGATRDDATSAAEDEDLDALKASLVAARERLEETRRRTEQERRQTQTHAAHSDHSRSRLLHRSLWETVVFVGALTWQLYVVRRWIQQCGPVLGR